MEKGALASDIFKCHSMHFLLAKTLWAEQVLKDKELKLVKLYLSNSELTFTDLCDDLNIKHREQVRLLKKIKKKYLEDEY